MLDWNERIEWLKDQAKEAYVWDEAASYWRVKTRWRYEGHPLATYPPPQIDLTHSFKHAAEWTEDNPNLSGNLMFRAWPELSVQSRSAINDWVRKQGLKDIEFFDHGGRAMAFRGIDERTGRYRILRVEADHSSRSIRIVHPSVLQPYAADESIDRIRLEILPEIVPLHKLPARPKLSAERSIVDVFQETVVVASHGTNFTYDADVFDVDTDAANVGILPDGKIVSLDPEFRFGKTAADWRKGFAKNFAEIKEFAPRLYGLVSNDLYF